MSLDEAAEYALSKEEADHPEITIAQESPAYHGPRDELTPESARL
jgi:hypothetical protein